MSTARQRLWCREQAIADKRADTRPMRANFETRGADAAAARLAAESLFSEPPVHPDLTDGALIDMFASTPVRRSELPAIRAAFLRRYAHRDGAFRDECGCPSASNTTDTLRD
jgi:hypothetical protein